MRTFKRVWSDDDAGLLVDSSHAWRIHHVMAHVISSDIVTKG